MKIRIRFQSRKLSFTFCTFDGIESESNLGTDITLYSQSAAVSHISGAQVISTIAKNDFQTFGNRLESM